MPTITDVAGLVLGVRQYVAKRKEQDRLRQEAVINALRREAQKSAFDLYGSFVQQGYSPDQAAQGASVTGYKMPSPGLNIPSPKLAQQEELRRMMEEGLDRRLGTRETGLTTRNDANNTTRRDIVDMTQEGLNTRQANELPLKAFGAAASAATGTGLGLGQTLTAVDSIRNGLPIPAFNNTELTPKQSQVNTHQGNQDTVAAGTLAERVRSNKQGEEIKKRSLVSQVRHWKELNNLRKSLLQMNIDSDTKRAMLQAWTSQRGQDLDFTLGQMKILESAQSEGKGKLETKYLSPAEQENLTAWRAELKTRRNDRLTTKFAGQNVGGPETEEERELREKIDDVMDTVKRRASQTKPASTLMPMTPSQVVPSRNPFTPGFSLDMPLDQLPRSRSYTLPGAKWQPGSVGTRSTLSTSRTTSRKPAPSRSKPKKKRKTLEDLL